MLANRSMPPSTVIPVLAYPDVGQAVDWLCDVFGFAERVRIGNHRAQLNVGDGAVVVAQQRLTQGSDSSLPRREAVSASVMVRIHDVDRHCQHATDRGARILQPPADYPYGERQYTVEDLAGYLWTFSHTIADVAPEEWGGTLITPR